MGWIECHCGDHSTQSIFFYFVIFCYILFCIVLQCFALPRDDIVPRCAKFNSACRSRSRLILHGPGRPLHCELQSVRICDIVWCVLMFFASLPLDDMVPSSMHTPLRVFMGFLWFSMVFYGFLWFSMVFQCFLMFSMVFYGFLMFSVFLAGQSVLAEVPWSTPKQIE